jgi:hypothetical protein
LFGFASGFDSGFASGSGSGAGAGSGSGCWFRFEVTDWRSTKGTSPEHPRDIPFAFRTMACVSPCNVEASSRTGCHLSLCLALLQKFQALVGVTITARTSRHNMVHLLVHFFFFIMAERCFLSRLLLSLGRHNIVTNRCRRRKLGSRIGCRRRSAR